MFSIENTPMFRLFAYTLLGVVTGYYLEVHPFFFLSISLLALSLGIYSLFKANLSIRGIGLSGVYFMLSLTTISAFNYSSQKSNKPVEDGYYKYRASVKKIINKKQAYTRCYLEVQSVDNNELKKPYKILSNIYSDDVLPGDIIYAQSFIRAINPPQNSGQFNTKKYYGYKFIRQTTSVQQANYITVHRSVTLQRLFYKVSEWCSNVFKKYIPERSALTMQALFLGKKSDISEDRIQVYMNAGVMHVLAVSGMHVGIIYLGFLMLLKPLYRKRKWISVLPIILVWLFSFVTGAGPAVLRAALMITFIDIGKKFNEDTNAVNLLFASGWLLLTFQPYLVWDIGFQLSFAAMLGIFFFMKPIQNLLYIKTGWIRNFIWTPAALSCSAQLAATPLTFFYFGNFPILFLLTNIVILLPVTFAMYLGTGLLCVSAILPEFISVWIGRIIDLVLHFGFDSFLGGIISLPGTYFNQIHLSVWQVFVLYAGILFLGYWMYHIKEGKWLLTALSLFTVTVFGSLVKQMNLDQKVKIALMYVPNQHAVAVNDYLWTAGSYTDGIVRSNSFFLKGYLREKQLKGWTGVAPEYVRQDSTGLMIGDLSIYILNSDLRKFSAQFPVRVDYLVLGDELFLDVNALQDKFRFKHLVLDGKLSYNRYNLFKRLLDKEGISYIDIRQDGAVELLL